MGGLLVAFAFVLVLATVSAIEDYNDDFGFGDCDQVIRLALNESFTFTTFPPRPRTLDYYGQYATALGRRRRRRGPRVCTWLFVARDADCHLEFHQRVSAYSRGDVDCKQQYFLFGDENREERFCSFQKPPLRLNSTGSRLFMTHFQRTEQYGYAVVDATSRVGGVVRCETPPPPPPKVCTPAPQSCITSPPDSCHDPGGCSIDIFISQPIFGQGPGIHCNSDPGQKCHTTGQMCFQTVPLNSPIPLLPPIPPLEEAPNCSNTTQFACPTPGNCTAVMLYEWNSDSSPWAGNVLNKPTCVAEPECTCVFQANICYIPHAPINSTINDNP